MGLEFLFLIQIGIGIIMIISLQKITQLKTKVDDITKEVENYIAFLTEDVSEERIQTESKQRKISKSVQMEESKNQLIQAVLKEYFP